MPHLSIIIPTFNSEKTFVRCLESLALQSYRDFEVIVMDGLSTDSTISIAESFRNKLSSLVVSSEKDSGVYDAMNKGIALANGEWIYFLGSDDELFDQNVLADVFVNNAEIISSNDFVYGDVNRPKHGERYDGEFDTLKFLFKNICHQAIFYRKSVYSVVGLYNLNYPILADYDYNIRCFGNINIRKAWLDLVIANYADGGLSSSVEDRNFFAQLNKVFESAVSSSELAKMLVILRTKHIQMENSKDNEISQRDNEISQRDNEIRQRDNEIRQRDNNVRSLEVTISQLIGSLEYKNDYITYLEGNQFSVATALKKAKNAIKKMIKPRI